MRSEPNRWPFQTRAVVGRADVSRTDDARLSAQKPAKALGGGPDRRLKPTAHVGSNPVDRLLGAGNGRALGLIFLIGSAVFVNSLANGFAYDDRTIIEGNLAVRYLRKPSVIFLNGYWPEPFPNNLYRPLVIASYAVNYAMGGITPWGYHFVNILLHALNGMLVYAVVRKLFQGRVLAFLSGIAFALHPIHTEAVANVVGRAELLAAFFVFLAWLAYLHARETVGLRRRAALAASMFCFALALLSKEHAVVLIGILALSDLLLELRHAPGPPVRRWTQMLGGLARPVYVWYVLILGVYLWIRFLVLGTVLGAEGTRFVDNPLAHSGGLVRVLTATKVLGQYLWLLLVPDRLSADYSYNSIPLSGSIGDPGVLLSLLVLIVLAALSWWARHRQPILAFSFGFFALTILPVSNLLFPIGTIMAERLLYLPSLGFCLALGAVLAAALSRTVGRSKAMSALCLVLFCGLSTAYATKTILRNPVWRDDRTLFLTTVRDKPQSAKVRSSVARLYAEEGRLEEARAEADAALSISPDYPFAHFELGNVMAKQGRLEEALGAYTKAVTLSPVYGDAYYEMGTIYDKMGRSAEAADAYRRAGQGVAVRREAAAEIALALFRLGSVAEAERQLERAAVRIPDSPELLNNLGLIYLRQERLEKARSYLQAASRLKPDSAEIWANLGKVLLRQGEVIQARSAFEKALALHPDSVEAKMGIGVIRVREGRLDESLEKLKDVVKASPHNAEARNNLGVTYERRGDFKEAARAFEAAVRLHPDYAEAHHNLGVVYGRQGRLAEARREFETAIRLKPNYAKAHYNLGVLLQQLGRRAEAQREIDIARRQGFPPGSRSGARSAW